MYLHGSIGWGQIPPELGNLSRLRKLDLGAEPGSPGLFGPIPPELGSLSNLEALILSHNSLTGVIPLELTNLPNLEILDLGHNELTGALPPTLGNLNYLRELDLFSNQFEGEVPESLSSVPGLVKFLFAGNNSLCAPSALQDWIWSIEWNYGPTCPEPTPDAAIDRAALVAFYHAAGGPGWINNDNWLTDIPLWGWYGVETDSNGRVIGLNFYNNGLSGSIPPELGRLSELTTLDLSTDWGRDFRSNNLTGPIPPELGKPFQSGSFGTDRQLVGRRHSPYVLETGQIGNS